MNDAGDTKKFHVDDNNSDLFKFKKELTGVTDAGGTEDVEIMVPLKYLSNFWITLQMPLTNREFNLFLTYFEKCMLFNDAKAITDMQ